ncbi:MAG TPA: hypothetical protein VG674_23195 [Amycolatopsis sp.]|nr:hypothetical protein [Amycolatopsis sp.]
MADKDDNSAGAADPAGLTSEDGKETAPHDAVRAEAGKESGPTEAGNATPPEAQPESTNPKPTNPEPTNTGPAKKESTKKEPTTPESANTEPTNPEPAKPEETSAGLPKAPPITGFPKAGVELVTADEGDDRPKAPGTVQIAFILSIVASIVLLLGQVVTILFKQQLVDQAVKSVPRGQKVDVAAIESNANVLVWALFVGALCFGLILVLFAYKAREGTRSARTVVTLLAILGLVFQLGIVRSIFSVVSSVLLVIMVIMLYVPGSADYFPKIPKKL